MPPLTRSFTPLLAGLLVLGCDPMPGGMPLPGRDAGPGLDGGKADGAPPFVRGDGGGMDAGVDGGALDAGHMIVGDAGEGCMVGAQSGVCMPTGLCDGVSTPGFCSGPPDNQCCTPRTDGGAGGMCDPMDRPLPNAGLTEAPGEAGCPSGMVRLTGFCIDRYEASLVRADGTGSLSPFHNPGSTRARAVSIAGAVPQGYINADQAAAACAEAGKRLCTEAEWERACQGASGRAAGRTYPYGDTRMDGLCNDARARHPAVERFGTSADWIWSRLGDACISQVPDSLTPTGSHPSCVTPEGVFDLMGNLHEWTSASGGVFRGGYYVDTYRNGQGCRYRTHLHDRSHWDYSTGFRCCAD